MTEIREAQKKFVRDAIERTGLDSTNLAKKSGFAPSTLNRFLNSENAKHKLKAPTLGAISRYARLPIPPDALGMEADPTQESDDFLHTGAPPPPDPDDIIEMSVRFGMGLGGEALTLQTTDEFGNTFSSEEEAGRWRMPPAYVLHELRINPKRARIVEVKGDSMEPSLKSGDRVMVDLDDTIPSPGGLFAIWDSTGTSVKRLEIVDERLDPPIVEVISDHPLHGRKQRTLGDEVRVVGRVVWMARRL